MLLMQMGVVPVTPYDEDRDRDQDGELNQDAFWWGVATERKLQKVLKLGTFTVNDAIRAALLTDSSGIEEYKIPLTGDLSTYGDSWRCWGEHINESWEEEGNEGREGYRVYVAVPGSLTGRVDERYTYVQHGDWDQAFTDALFVAFKAHIEDLLPLFTVDSTYVVTASRDFSYASEVITPGEKYEIHPMSQRGRERVMAEAVMKLWPEANPATAAAMHIMANQ